MKFALLLVALVAPASQLTAQADTRIHAEREAIVVAPTAVKWVAAPSVLPAGAKVSVLEGDPSKPGPFTMRLAIPSGYRILPHFHSADEHVTVIEGVFQIGMGDKFDPSKLTDLPAGSFVVLPTGMRHFAQSQGETIVQVHGVGPWSLTYVNPADDPRAEKPAVNK